MPSPAIHNVLHATRLRTICDFKIGRPERMDCVFLPHPTEMGPEEKGLFTPFWLSHAAHSHSTQMTPHLFVPAQRETASSAPIQTLPSSPSLLSSLKLYRGKQQEGTVTAPQPAPEPPCQGDQTLSMPLMPSHAQKHGLHSQVPPSLSVSPPRRPLCHCSR